ncbi:hypothetical protein OG698_40905 [Streptomyces sp. NBC_01003]|nr:hypothetical protein OG698_40905 [Streptomyces sp. NBC_01003]
MADLPLPDRHAPPHWLDGEQTTRPRWRRLVTTRQNLLRARQQE